MTFEKKSAVGFDDVVSCCFLKDWKQKKMIIINDRMNGYYEIIRHNVNMK